MSPDCRSYLAHVTVITIESDLPNCHKIILGFSTNLKSDLQSISGDLQDSGLSQLTRNTHPRVGCEHGATQLLAGNDHHMVGDHWNTERGKTSHEVINTRRTSSTVIQGYVAPKQHSLMVVNTLVKQK